MSKNEENAIVVKNLSKSFRLPHEQSSGLKQSIVNFFKKKKGYEIQEVLKNISFEVKKGDFFGIVGRNGSGKSTLLKLLAGIYNTDEGSISINGSIIPFIELGVGFNPELTGRENIFLNGALLGFSRKEMEAMYDDIVEFAELEKFMDQKLKNYSSGMQVRLAFSIAIKAQGDILILDEVLAVGDEAFQRKCQEYFASIKKDKNKTVILVTHSMENVRKYCNKAMLVQYGVIKMIGDPNSVADEYYGINLSKTALIKKVDKSNKPNLSAEIIGKKILESNDILKIKIKYRALNKIPVVIKAYIDYRGQPLMVTNPNQLGQKEMITSDTKEHIVEYNLPLGIFNDGEYKIIVLLEDLKDRYNIASYGYDSELLIKIRNKNNKFINGALLNKGTLVFKDE